MRLGLLGCDRSRADNRPCCDQLLDTIAGSLTVYLNDIRLGVMQASGLTGVYRWAVSMRCAGDSVRLESAPAPPLQIGWGHDTGNEGDDDDDVM